MTNGSVSSAILDRVEEQLQLALDALPEPGGTGSRRIIAAGGKRLRPELLLLCASLGPTGTLHPGRLAGTISAAVAVELLHSATLLHDDLLDGSETRRGVAAVHVQEGLTAAVVSGDALIAQSWRLIARVGPDDAEDLADALADMCAGEALEEQLKYSSDAVALDVLRVSQLKTGALLKAACRIGARRAGCAPAQVAALGTFGSDFGVSLQLVDDVLDVISDPELLGKPCGADFATGTVTMPAVFAMSTTRPGDSDDELDREELRALLRPGLAPAGCARAQELILRSDGPARAAELARSFARRAARSVPAGSPAAAALAAMPGAFVSRQLQSKVSATRRRLLAQGAAVEPSMLGDAG